MPVRSLNSSVFTWPDTRTVDQAVRRWAKNVARTRPDITRIGYIGSYARGDWGVGSDLDVLVFLEDAELPFMERALAFDLGEFPVPVDIQVYTEDEWRRLRQGGRRFAKTVEQEAVWVYRRDEQPCP